MMTMAYPSGYAIYHNSRYESEATRLAKMMGKELGESTNIKVVNMQTKSCPITVMLYNLQKAYMKLEVTFDTEK